MSPFLKALVTGGAGFIGRRLVEQMRQVGWTVTVLDVAAPPAGFDPALVYVQGSVLDDALTDRLIGEAERVIHLAGIAEPMRYGSHPLETMDVNLLGSINVAKACARHDRPLLFASTSEIYGVNPNVPWRENADRILGPVANVRWCYSSAKAAAEHYLDALRRQLGLKYAVVRLFNAYGPGLRGRVVDGFVAAALADQPLVIHGDGLQTRCFCYVDDVVEALMAIITSPMDRGGVYNVGVEEETSVLDLARKIIHLARSTSRLDVIPYDQLYDGYQDIVRRQPNTQALRDDFGWAPRTSLEDGLALMIEVQRQEHSHVG
ncbi:NAD-dependent epimerase/dehydratase family protein [Caulobacter sp. UC70_42]|uniref:NAD-dependent epimerase/dehydratase family protein n=1 Tax=Caulobacter sp. UC70_42 TaxID=3374551 RepID=UPI003757CDCF